MNRPSRTSNRRSHEPDRSTSRSTLPTNTARRPVTTGVYTGVARNDHQGRDLPWPTQTTTGSRRGCRQGPTASRGLSMGADVLCTFARPTSKGATDSSIQKALRAAFSAATPGSAVDLSLTTLNGASEALLDELIASAQLLALRVRVVCGVFGVYNTDPMQTTEVGFDVRVARQLARLCEPRSAQDAGVVNGFFSVSDRQKQLIDRALADDGVDAWVRVETHDPGYRNHCKLAIFESVDLWPDRGPCPAGFVTSSNLGDPEKFNAAVMVPLTKAVYQAFVDFYGEQVASFDTGPQPRVGVRRLASEYTSFFLPARRGDYVRSLLRDFDAWPTTGILDWMCRPRAGPMLAAAFC